MGCYDIDFLRVTRLFGILTVEVYRVIINPELATKVSILFSYGSFTFQPSFVWSGKRCDWRVSTIGASASATDAQCGINGSSISRLSW